MILELKLFTSFSFSYDDKDVMIQQFKHIKFFVDLLYFNGHFIKQIYGLFFVLVYIFSYNT